MSNLYYDPSEDEDILGDKTIEDKQKNYRNKITGPNGEPLPDHIQEILSEYIDATEGIQASRVPLAFKAMSSVFDFFAEFQTYGESGALLTAIAEVVNTISDGMLLNVYNHTEARRKLISSHTIKKYLNSLLEMITYTEKKEYVGELNCYIETYANFIDYMASNAIDTYVKYCEILDVEVDQSIIDEGCISERNLWERIGLSNPPAICDV